MSDISNAQNRNLGNLLKIFGNKQATDALKEMAKVKASTWTDIKDTVSDLKVLSTGGGTGAIITSFKDTIDLSLEAAISPLSNEVNQLITDWMIDNITPKLTDIVNDLAAFISENRVGGTAGGIAGQILAFFLPGGRIWEIVGALVGASIQDFFENPKEPGDLWFSGLHNFIKEFEANMLENTRLRAEEARKRAEAATFARVRAEFEAKQERAAIARALLTPEELSELLAERAAERLERERRRRLDPTGRGLVF